MSICCSRNSFNHGLGLTPELPQVAPEPPTAITRHAQRMFENGMVGPAACIGTFARSQAGFLFSEDLHRNLEKLQIFNGFLTYFVDFKDFH